MIIRGTPINIDDYEKVDSETSVTLQKFGFIPKYIDENYIYYKKTNMLLDSIDALNHWKGVN